jgi:hypothetical protein
MDIYTLILLLFITTIAFFAIRFFSRRKKKEIVEPVGMSELGFSALVDPNPSLLLHINQLHQKYPNQDLVLHDVFYKKQDNIELFLFDIHDRGGKEISVFAQDVIAVISPILNPPRITMLSRPGNTGFSGFLTDRFISHIANWENLQDLKIFSLTDYPDFNRRYYVFCTDENQAQEFLTEPRVKYLLQQNNKYALEMDQGIISLHLTASPPNLSRQERIQQTTSKSLEMVKVFT